MPLVTDNLNATSSSVSATEFESTFRINADFLSSCAHKCPGCFANRVNEFNESDLDVLSDLAHQVKGSGIAFDELVLGPVDLLGSDNGLDILRHETFRSVVADVGPLLVMPTTLQDSTAKIGELLDVLSAYPDSAEFEFQIVADVERLVSGDIMYRQMLKQKIAMLGLASQQIEYLLLVNIRRLKPGYLQALTVIAREEFDCFLGFSPSVFRSGDASVVNKVVGMWNAFLETEITPELKHMTPMPMVDQAHGWFNQSAWSFGDGNLYISPNIFDQVVDFRPEFKVPRSGKYYDLPSVLAWLQESWSTQMAYAQQTVECQSCEYLPICTSRQALTYMKAYGMTACPYPKRVMQLWS